MNLFLLACGVFLCLCHCLLHVSPFAIQPRRNVRCHLLTLKSSSSSADDLVAIGDEKRRGLLRGVNPQTAEYFSVNISMTREDLAWLKEPGVFWDAARKDAQIQNVDAEAYLEKICSNFQTFFLSRKVHDRAGIQRYLTRAIQNKGEFSLVVGGKSLGKSLVLANLCDRYNYGDRNEAGYMVLYVDGRIHQDDLAEGLLIELAALQVITVANIAFTKNERDEALLLSTQFFREKGSDMAKAALKTFMAGLKINELTTQITVDIFSYLVRFMINKDLPEKLPSSAAIQSFIKLASEQRRHPVVIIDEANELLGKNPVETRSSLLKFVEATKQANAMNVILVTSEYGFPYKLERAGFNLQELTSSAVFGDLSPKDTWDLLVTAENNTTGIKTIGMGQDLAELCLAAYGGHPLFICYAMRALLAQQKKFFALRYLPDLSRDILSCMQLPVARSLLDSLARHGFVAVEDYQVESVETIVNKKIGGVLNLRKSDAEHVPETCWQGTEYGYALLPSYMSVRLAIAEELKGMNGQDTALTEFAGGG